MAPLTPEERTRLLAEIDAEFEAAERSIREEGVVTAEELERHWDALLVELEEQEEREKRSAIALAKRGLPAPPGSVPI